MKTSTIIAVVISSLIIRAFLEILFSNALSVNSFYIDSFTQIFMYLLIFACLWREYVLNYRIPKSRNGNFKNLAIFASMLALVCVLFSYGSMTLVANIGSYVNPEATYRYFDFHTKKGPVYGILSGRTLIFILATVVLAPIAEELVFRGMLLSNFVKSRGHVLGLVFTSITFTIFHFSSPDLIGTFIFSLVVSVFYLEKKSIRACMVTHALYNFIAFIYQYYFGGWWIRSIDALKDANYWSGGYLALTISLAAFLFFCKFGYIKLKMAQKN